MLSYKWRVSLVFSATVFCLFVLAFRGLMGVAFVGMFLLALVGFRVIWGLGSDFGREFGALVSGMADEPGERLETGNSPDPSYFGGDDRP